MNRRESFSITWTFYTHTVASLTKGGLAGAKNLVCDYVVCDGKGITDDNSDIYIRFHTRENNAVINVYQKKLPFDTLVATLNFCLQTGRVEDHYYGFPINFNEMVICFSKDAVAQKQWLKIGQDIYRVDSEEGLNDLLGNIELHPFQRESALNEYKRLKCDCVLFAYSNGAFVLTVIDHPTWKNDSLWQSSVITN